MSLPLRAALLASALLASLAFLAAPAAAHHAACGDPDGYLVTPDLSIWLRPGCMGASYASSQSACLDQVDERFGSVTVVVLVDGYPCTLFGVWLA